MQQGVPNIKGGRAQTSLQYSPGSQDGYFWINRKVLQSTTPQFLSRISEPGRLREIECGLINCPLMFGRSIIGPKNILVSKHHLNSSELRGNLLTSVFASWISVLQEWCERSRITLTDLDHPGLEINFNIFLVKFR